MVEEDNWLRNDIFHTMCTSHGKVCNVIIDRGSCENEIATIMVEKLNLKTVDHPRSYKLSWLHKGNEVRERIIKQNKKYQRQANKHRKPAAFKEGNLVWVHLHKGRFPRGKHRKLKPRANGPFKVLKRVGDNAYKIELPRDHGVLAIFDVASLSPYHGCKDEENSGTSYYATEVYDTESGLV
ncbi:hypothetical protein D8674_002502 [Pyrus ussuriensis x Pyrus communis]|uniref:Tf2-1-like SH3-like domain-containing protein n=1 Tax=Pyrus ussuriensis x Pyrus communis TaxID=2448454 RepID=A0A5N5FEX4_9ROSA|nr:hypothetical protein D8674_002502 [Pyrus ussuriensis x Pyrus communis]